MHSVRSWGGAWSAAIVVGLASIAIAQEKKPSGDKPAAADAKKPEGGAPAMTAEQAAEMDAYMKAGTPGPEHKQLEYMIGTWDVLVKHWVAPEAPPAEGKGTSVAEWILGGRFTRYTFTGDFMGMPFEGRGITGYDNIEKKYVSVWVDSMSTWVQQEKGSYDAATKTFSFMGESKKPTGVVAKTRNVTKVVGPDQHVMTFFETLPGKPESKNMEITYTRAKSPAKP